MHRIFRISEILDLIFAALQGSFSEEPHWISREERNKVLGRGELAALARTCKTFCDQALDLLWREQETLANILKCLPSDLWKEERKRISPRHTKLNFSIIGSISSADWYIPLAYATRIRKLVLTSGNMDNDFSSVIDVFEMIAGSKLPRPHLCPNLQTLVFHCDKASLYLPLFLGPKITHVEISLPDSSISELPLRYSELRTLHLYPESLKSSLGSKALSKIAMSLNSIEYLSLPSLDEAALEHVSRLPGLRSMEVDTLVLAAPRLRSLVEPRAVSFAALRDVYLADTTHEVAIQFLESLSNCRLTSFRIATFEPATKSITRRLYAAMANYLSHAANSFDGPPTNYAIDGYTLSTLLCFSNLTKISLEPPTGFTLDDTMAWDIARAWPKVRSLWLAGSTEEPRSSSMSLLGLTAFAKHCHDLTSLTIGFDASTVPPLDDPTVTIVSQLSLTYLSVDMSPITDPYAVANFISVLFSNLASIQTHDGCLWEDFDLEDISTEDDASAYHRVQRWKQVDAMLRSSKGASK
ncbi:hypothetical protein MSAN_00207900 [Mycena sanguinolenta]|uniref:F-box domain-containing protein n=1 Tax=Mycena sanguinolenta TaxID=230812 RepID=A0A8H7DJM5_9AGAR|nr:hypothetical protein MSAN_00207900 [Mycena sanguinolenta]